MHRRNLLRLAALSPLLTAGRVIASAPTATDSTPTHSTSTGTTPTGTTPTDLMPAFWSAYDDTRGARDRVPALASAFFAPHAELHAGAGLKPTHERLARWLPDFDAMANDVRRLSGEFARHYARHVEHFAGEFPDFRREQAPIYLMPSLFGFDGHLQPWQGRLPLFIGLDGIVRYPRGRGEPVGVSGSRVVPSVTRPRCCPT